MSLRDIRREEFPNWDWITNLTLFVVVSPTFASYLGLVEGSTALAAATGLGAFAAVYELRKSDGELRESEEEERPAVRPDFLSGERKSDLGFTNYGPGAALYLQAEATLGDTDEPLFRINPTEPPLHLSEGESVGFLSTESIDTERLEEIIEEEQNCQYVNFYYSYISPTGVREPPEVTDEVESEDTCIHDLLKRKSQKPRQIRMSTIRSNVDLSPD